MSDETDINPGDVVQLRSGGPSMTVVSKSLNGQFVVCEWFDAVNVLHAVDTSCKSLRLVPGKPESK